MYDAWLLDSATPSMLDARDAYLAADMMRFGGANQVELWRGFAQRGMGSGAVTNTNEDHQATPSFESPAEPNATVTFSAVASEQGNAAVPAQVYVGRYEDRAMPIADTDPGTTLSNTAKFVPGTYEFIVQAPGYGLSRFTQTFTATATAVTFKLQTNWASSAKGASITGDGTSDELAKLIDDTENTNWTATGRMPSVAGTSATVALGGGAHKVSSVRVSAMIGAGQFRFTALRKFGIDACDATTTDCSVAANFTPRLHEPGRRVPGREAAAGRAEPVAPDLRPSAGGHGHAPVGSVVLTNQCTGMPGIQEDSDNDPTNDSGCIGSGKDTDVVVTELEAFTQPGADIDVTKTGPATLKNGTNATYTVTVKNNGPEAATGVVAVDKLPFKAELKTVTPSVGTCSKATVNNVTTVTCKLGNMASGATTTITLVARLRVTGRTRTRSR